MHAHNKLAGCGLPVLQANTAALHAGQVKSTMWPCMLLSTCYSVYADRDLTTDQGRHLVTQAFAATCCHHHQPIAACKGIDDDSLLRLPAGGAVHLVSDQYLHTPSPKSAILLHG
jgi:hypothetical protein